MYSDEIYSSDEGASNSPKQSDVNRKKSGKAHLCQAKRSSSILEELPGEQPADLCVCSACGGEGCGDDFDHLTTVPKYKNRYVRGFFIYVGLLLAASCYSNWQPMFLILNRMGAMAWVCDEPGATHDADFAECDQQYDQLTQMYTVGANMAYIVGLVAGVLMDIVGARITAVLGTVVVYAGWFMLVFSSKEAQMYWPGLTFLGMAENLLGFPGFTVGDMFPSLKDTCASLCIAMQMLSSWIPVLIWAIIEHKESVEGIATKALSYYLVIIAVPMIFYVLSTPGKNTVIPTGKKLVPKPVNVVVKEDKVSKMSMAYWKDVLVIVVSFDFILFTVWYICLTLGFAFYNTKVMVHSGQDIGELIGLLNPFRAAIGPVMGVLSDYVGVFPMLILDNIMIAAAFGLSLFEKGQSTSAVFYIMGRAFCFTTKYVFVQNYFPREHFGKLCGLISFLGGMFGFLNTWFVVIDVPTQTTFSIACIAMLALTTVPVYFLWKTIRENKKAKIGEAAEPLAVTEMA